MDRDKIIAGALVLSFAFLLVAFIGVLGITGFLLYTSADSQGSINSGSNTASPIIGTNGTVSGLNSNNSGTLGGLSDNNSNDSTGDDGAGDDDSGDSGEDEPVCGNDVKETGEACEEDADCSASQECNNSCECIAKAPESAALEGIKVDSLVFVTSCVILDNETGLGVSQIILKNNGDSNFTYTGNITVEAVTGDVTDSINLGTITNLRINKGRTERIYMNKTSRTEKFLFLGKSAVETNITLKFKDNKIVEYSKTLRAQDFTSANCI